jgi:hypothetical protein
VARLPVDEVLTNQRVAGRKRLFAIGERSRGHEKEALAAHARLLRVHALCVGGSTAATRAIRGATLAASARAAGKNVTRGSLDKKDGEAFHLLEAIIDAFEKAHDIDPTIPRLVPISMRRHFGTHKTKTPAAATPPVA